MTRQEKISNQHILKEQKYDLKTPESIKTDYLNHYFIRGQNDTKRT